MSYTTFEKNEVSIMGLTPLEYDILWLCLDRCKEVMRWDDRIGCASDCGNFTWEIFDEEEYNTLKNLDI